MVTTMADPPAKDLSLAAFTQDTSMHGLKYVTAEGRVMRRLFWAMAVVVMGATLIYTLCTQLVAFRTFPVLTKSTRGEADSLEFPAVTICNLNGMSTKNFTPDERLRNYLYETGKLGFITRPINWTDHFYDWVLDENFMLRVATQLETLIYIAFWQGKQINVTEHFKPRITANGVCYTFNDLSESAENVGQQTRIPGNLAGLILGINIEQQYYYYGRYNMAAGVKVVLNDPREEPDVMSRGISIAPGFTSFVALRHQSSSYLPSPYQAFKDGYCIESNATDFVNPLKHHRRYSYQACLTECQADYTVGRCGCRTFALPGNATVCTLRQSKECAFPANDEFYLDPTHKSKCGCQKPCKMKHYRTELSSAYFPAEGVQNYWVKQTEVRKNFLELRLFYQELEYDHVEQVPEYTLEGILANLGGQMGLFLGASVLTAAELLEFVLRHVISLVRRIRPSANQTRVQTFSPQN